MTFAEVAQERRYQAVISRMGCHARSFRLSSLREALLHICLKDDGTQFPELTAPV